MQYVGPLAYQNIFKDTVLAQTKIMIPNIEKLLAGWTVYLGINPTDPARPNSGNPHTDPDRKLWYVPMPNPIPGENRDEVAAVQIWKHEGAGHGLHHELPVDWEEWARATGHILDMTWRAGGGSGLNFDPNYHYCPSFEDFAVDVVRMIDTKTPHPYYTKLFGLQYQVITPGSKTYIVNGLPAEKDAAPVIINGRTYVPLRHTHENFGDTVDYSNGRILIVREM